MSDLRHGKRGGLERQKAEEQWDKLTKESTTLAEPSDRNDVLTEKRVMGQGSAELQGGDGTLSVRHEGGAGVKSARYQEGAEVQMGAVVAKNLGADSTKLRQKRDADRLKRYRRLIAGILGDRITDEQASGRLQRIYAKYEEELKDGGFLAEGRKRALREEVQRELNQLGVSEDQQANLDTVWDATVDKLIKD